MDLSLVHPTLLVLQGVKVQTSCQCIDNGCTVGAKHWVDVGVVAQCFLDQQPQRCDMLNESLTGHLSMYVSTSDDGHAPSNKLIDMLKPPLLLMNLPWPTEAHCETVPLEGINAGGLRSALRTPLGRHRLSSPLLTATPQSNRSRRPVRMLGIAQL